MTMSVKQKVKQRAGTAGAAAGCCLCRCSCSRAGHDVARPLRPAPPQLPPGALCSPPCCSNEEPRQPAARPHWLRQRSKFHEGTPTSARGTRCCSFHFTEKNLPGD
nr:uncharacterized protein LOC129038574 [Pongo pygmaeus]